MRSIENQPSLISTPVDYYQPTEDTAVLRCPKCKTPDRWVALGQSWDDGQGNTHLLVKCKKCGILNNPIGAQEWIKQIARMAEHA